MTKQQHTATHRPKGWIPEPDNNREVYTLSRFDLELSIWRWRYENSPWFASCTMLFDNANIGECGYQEAARKAYDLMKGKLGNLLLFSDMVERITRVGGGWEHIK